MENIKNEEKSPVKRAKAIKIEIKRIVEEDPDLSFLETTAEIHYGENGSNWEHVPEEDKRKVIDNYGSIWNACIAYARRDKKRLEDYRRGVWDMIGIKAVATIHIPIEDNSSKIQTIDSGGLWGVESDSEDVYIKEIEKEQIGEIKKYLRVLCVENIDGCEMPPEINWHRPSVEI